MSVHRVAASRAAACSPGPELAMLCTTRGLYPAGAPTCTATCWPLGLRSRSSTGCGSASLRATAPAACASACGEGGMQDGSRVLCLMCLMCLPCASGGGGCARGGRPSIWGTALPTACCQPAQACTHAMSQEQVPAEVAGAARRRGANAAGQVGLGGRPTLPLTHTALHLAQRLPPSLTPTLPATLHCILHAATLQPVAPDCDVVPSGEPPAAGSGANHVLAMGGGG